MNFATVRQWGLSVMPQTVGSLGEGGAASFRSVDGKLDDIAEKVKLFDINYLNVLHISSAVAASSFCAITKISFHNRASR